MVGQPAAEVGTAVSGDGVRSDGAADRAVIPVPMKIRFCDTVMSYIGLHEAEPNPDEPGFCFCGLELDERVHRDREKYATAEEATGG